MTGKRIGSLLTNSRKLEYDKWVLSNLLQMGQRKRRRGNLIQNDFSFALANDHLPSIDTFSHFFAEAKTISKDDMF